MTCDLRFFVAAAVDVLTASNNDVKTSRNSNRAFCTTIKSLFRFERINKLDRFQSYWQLFSFFLPLEILRDIAVISSVLKGVQR